MSPKSVSVVISCLAFSSNTGVPVKPKSSARGKVCLMLTSMSPNTLRWHSSMMNTNRFLPILSSSSLVMVPPLDMAASSFRLLIFWIEVTIRRSSLSMLFSLASSTEVSAVSCISSLSPAKPLYSSSDCSASSMRSSRNTTLSASPLLAMSSALLNDDIVLPEPVVCQM